MKPLDDKDILAFRSPEKWEQWLAKNHDERDGIWLRFYKKASGTPTVTYAEALDVALCYGWIDGQGRGLDEVSYIQWFTRRGKRSLWSKKNIGHVTRLRKAGRMQPAGQQQIDAAKADGRWDKAYDPPSTMIVPADFLKALSKNKKALAFYKTLNKANTYAIAWRLHTATKLETRERRMKLLLAMMADGKKLH